MPVAVPIEVPASPVPGIVPEPIRLVGSPAPPRRFRRHFPRICRSCRAPLAVQEADCWRCGAHSSPNPK
jgi:hypothetical protein